MWLVIKQFLNLSGVVPPSSIHRSSKDKKYPRVISRVKMVRLIRFVSLVFMIPAVHMGKFCITDLTGLF